MLEPGSRPADCRLRLYVRRRRSPIEWETPTGKAATVNLELQLSAFFGYGKVAEDAYLGLQCHGVLWPAVTAEAPVHWPIAPPIVSGKARLPASPPLAPENYGIEMEHRGCIDRQHARRLWRERARAGTERRRPAA